VIVVSFTRCLISSVVKRASENILERYGALGAAIYRERDLGPAPYLGKFEESPLGSHHRVNGSYLCIEAIGDPALVAERRHVH
jgi:hypothetical protein